jgi:peptide/nickel transport system permease protein
MLFLFPILNTKNITYFRICKHNAMVKYIFRKLMYGFLVLILVVVLVSSIIFLSPVDPTRLTFGQRSDTATMKAKQAELGLDQPLYIQLGKYLNDVSPISVFTDNPQSQTKYNYLKIMPLGSQVLVLKVPYLRESFQNGRSVSEIISTAIPKTALLALVAIIIASFIGISLGVLAALKQNSWIDSLASTISILGYSMPSYVVAIFMALIFGYWFSAYTGLNIQGSIIELNDEGDEIVIWKNIILPAFALGLRPVAIITLLTRSSMLDVLNQDFIRTAKAKGLSHSVVILKHALRNALNPVITAISGWFAALLTGAFFIESVFSYKGLGEVTVNALINFDIPVVLGSVIFTVFIFVIINVLADILYAFIDPRVKLE